jgi:hypothetical protein
MKKKVLLAVPLVVLSLVGCVPKYYTDEFLEEKNIEFTELASNWFETNLPDAENITYEAKHDSSYVSNLCKGSFDYNDETYNYALNMDDFTLYTDKTESGITLDDVKSTVLEILNSYYTDERGVSVDVEFDTEYFHNFDFDFFCSEYVQTSHGGDKIYDPPQVSTHKHSDLSYLEWDTAVDDLYDLCYSWLKMDWYDSRLDIKLKVTYNDFNDIKSDLKKGTILDKFPCIDSVRYYSADNSDESDGSTAYYMLDSKSVYEYYYTTDDDGNKSLEKKKYK